MPPTFGVRVFALVVWMQALYRTEITMNEGPHGLRNLIPPRGFCQYKAS